VTDEEFEQRLRHLELLLDELVALLQNVNESHWLAWAERCKDELGSRDRAAFDELLGAYGGMGSFNDLVLMKANRHAVAVADEGAVSERLWDLRTSIWEDATALRRSLQ